MLYKMGHTDTPKEYNQKIVLSKLSGNYGCIGQLACEECGTINADSICLCSGYFTCCECNAEHGKRISDIKYINSGELLNIRPVSSSLEDGMGI